MIFSNLLTRVVVNINFTIHLCALVTYRRIKHFQDVGQCCRVFPAPLTLNFKIFIVVFFVIWVIGQSEEEEKNARRKREKKNQFQFQSN